MNKPYRVMVMALLLTFLVTALAQAADWQLTCTDSKGLRWYVDTETIHVKAPHIGVMQKIVKQDGSYFIVLFAANYQQRTYVIAKATAYNSSGQVTQRDPGCSTEERIAPNSPADRTLNYIMRITSLY
jgi:hypothetical protein